MSDELSRVKSRQKNKKKRGNASGTKAGKEASAEAPPARRKEVSGQTLSRTRRKKAAGAKSGTETQSAESVRGGKRSGRPKAWRKEAPSVPSRSTTYRSERIRLSKLFVNTLNVLFMLLLILLLVWGIKGAPPLRTLW